MSKARLFELKRKWRLGKLSADYRSHKKNKQGLGYLKEPTLHFRSRKRIEKRNKCDHDFVLYNEYNYSFLGEKVWQEFHCSKCSKKKLATRNVFDRTSDENKGVS